MTSQFHCASKSIMSDWKQKLIKGKIVASEAETAREYGEWYTSRWKADYPDAYETPQSIVRDIYNNNIMPTYRTMYSRRPVRPLYTYRRRRLTAVSTPRAKRAIAFATPSPRKRGRRGMARSYGTGLRSKAYLFGRQNVGQRVGEGTSKTAITSSEDLVTRSTYQLNVFDLCQITKGDQVTERERFIVNLRGFKLRMFVKSTHKGAPICFNYALVAGRSKNVVSQNDIFRSTSFSGRSSGLDTGGGLSNCFADINTDEYVCLKHKRIFLSESDEDDLAGEAYNTKFNKSSWKMMEFYFPLKRQMRFADNAPTSCNEKVFLIYWIQIIDSPQPNSENPPEEKEAAVVSHQCKAYFKEPKN